MRTRLARLASGRSIAILATSIAAMFGTPAAAQCDAGEWIRIPSRTQSENVGIQGSLAYDLVRSRAVLFGGSGSLGESNVGNETWLWDGQRWAQANPAVRPPGRRWAAMAYDAARDRMVLFGGASNNTYIGDTWVWNGSTWAQMAVPGPSPRRQCAIAYDSARQRVVLFGGRAAGAGVVRLDETWEWDGAAWTQILPPGSSPSPRHSSAMVYDSVRGVCVLYGGDAAAGAVADTWEWNGAAWTRRTPTTSPPASAGHTMAYDPVRQRAVMYRDDGGVWEWAGVVWVRRADSAGEDAPQHAGLMTFSAAEGRVLLMSQSYYGTWHRKPSGWERRAATPVGDTSTTPHVLDPITKRAMLYGGSIDTPFFWTGATWLSMGDAPLGVPYENASLAADTWRNRVVMVGGLDGNQPQSEMNRTFVWDGVAWVELPVAGPPADSGRAMGFDEHRGYAIYCESSSTWLWDGAAWISPGVASPGSVPRLVSMTYDPTRQRVVYAEATGNGFPINLWEWTGAAWASIPALNAPVLTGNGICLVYDPDCDRLTLIGQVAFDSPIGVWTFDGARWTALNLANPPPKRSVVRAVYDPLRHAIVLHGGVTARTASLFPIHDFDVWEYVSRPPCPADTNGDRLVNFADLNTVLAQFGQSATPGVLAGDVNDDGYITFADLNLVLSAFGAAC